MNVKPWWKSRTMVAAYVGLVIAVTDALSTVMLGQDLSWRTAVICVGSALAAWGRKSASTVITSWLGLPASDEEPKP